MARGASVYERLFFTSLAIIFTASFALWWFNPAHIPQNFDGVKIIFDVVLFLLVSYVIWQPIVMDVLTWSISSYISDIKKQKPVPGARVAFITTIVPGKEPVELLHKCLPAMVKAHYEHDTWLLDEGNNEEVKKVCELYGVKHFSRAGKPQFNTPDGKYTRTKGGNHNSWYDSYGDNYDFVAQIDTDFVPKRNFLTETLGYFRDPKVAFVGTPQVYANTEDSIIALGAAEQQYNFYGAVLRGLSGMGMMLLIGANHVIRVSAFRKVDHYTAHITEDLVTGMKLHANGYKSVYVPEPLAFGEGPSSWESYFNQQFRWAYGCIDILFHHSPEHFRKMNVRRAIYYFFLQQHYFSGLAMGISVLLLSLYFIFGIRVANVDVFQFLIFYSLVMLAGWLMSVYMQRFDVYRKNSGQLLLAGKIISVAAWPIWFMALVSVILGKKINYKVTPKGSGPIHVKVKLSTFLPHFTLALIALVGVASSYLTGRHSGVMLFWAISTAVVMVTIPFADNIFRFICKIKSILLFCWRKFFLGTVGDGEIIDIRGMVADILFLFTAIYISVVFYITKLGFYSDDWSFLGNFSLSSKSLLALFKTATTANTFMRPMQNVYDVILFAIFGRTPLGYHIVNSLVFSLVIILLYLLLRQLKTPRIIAITIPLVFSFLPNYSTDRFWYAAFQVNLSMLFFLLSTTIGLKALSLKGFKSFLLKVGSILTLILSGLSYEIVLPLVLINMFLFWNPLKRAYKERSAFAVLNFIVLIYLIIFKVKTTVRLGNFNYPGDVVKLVVSIFRTNFIQLGLRLPNIWWQIITKYSNVTVLLLAGVLFSLVFLYLFYVTYLGNQNIPKASTMRLIILSGVLIFFVGYAIFFTNNKIGFSPIGIDNRVTMAASIGLAFMIVGVVGLVCRIIKSEIFSKWLFSLLVGIVCAGGFLIINTLAIFWSMAYSQSNSVLADIHSHFTSLPQKSTFILDGVCPYQGPGIVFESQWDLKGALQMMYQNNTIQADIVTPRLKVTDDGIDTQIYTFKTHYTYDNLLLYNYKYKKAFVLNNAEEAQNYFQEFNPDHNNNCPPASAGNGVNVF